MISSLSAVKTVKKVWPVAVWLIIWYAASKLIGQEIILASPVSVFQKLIELGGKADFWERVFNSYGRVMLGLMLGALLGTGLGVLASVSAFMKELMKPIINLMRTVPVASFIILALVWLNKSSLSTFIALIVCLPVFWSSTVEGIKSADRQLLEAAQVFRFRATDKLRAVYLPALCPHFIVAFETTVGLAWKSGIAAELIAVPSGSVGEMLYYAKVWLATDEMLAWTAAAVMLSSITSRIIKLLLERWERVYE